MKRMMSWTPTPSHLMKQMPRKRGPRHKGLESTKWNDEISYLGSEKLMSFWAIFLVLHFASLICGNPLFGCYKGGNIRRYTSYHVDTSYHRGTPDHISSNLIASMKKSSLPSWIAVLSWPIGSAGDVSMFFPIQKRKICRAAIFRKYHITIWII